MLASITNLSLFIYSEIGVERSNLNEIKQKDKVTNLIYFPRGPMRIWHKMGVQFPPEVIKIAQTKNFSDTLVPMA